MCTWWLVPISFGKHENTEQEYIVLCHALHRRSYLNLYHFIENLYFKKRNDPYMPTICMCQLQQIFL